MLRGMLSTTEDFVIKWKKVMCTIILCRVTQKRETILEAEFQSGKKTSKRTRAGP